MRVLSVVPPWRFFPWRASDTSTNATSVYLKNFTWYPCEGINCLVGARDCGKSSVLDAIDLCLGARRYVTFAEADFYCLDVTAPVSISITIRELDDGLKNMDAYGPVPAFLRREHRSNRTIGDVGLWIGHRTCGNVVFELPERTQVFPSRYRHAACREDAGVAGNIVGDDRLLEPGEVERLKRAGRADRFLHRPLHVGIRHQWKALAEMFAHRLDTCNVGCKIGAADLHLDGAKAFGEIVIGLLQERLDREIEVNAAGIAGHAGIKATK